MNRPLPTMASEAELPLNRTAEVLRILEDYLAQMEQGVPPAPDELLAAHPDLAEPLKAYLASLEFLHRAALSLHGSDEAKEAAAAGDISQLGTLGDFRLLREIGRGGMGVVYEAEQMSLKRRVALKVMPFAATLDSKRLLRFQNEAQAAACLHHTNIVPVFAVGQERAVHYYAMQLVEGQTLAELIEELKEAKRPNHRDTKNTEEKQKEDKQSEEAGAQATLRGRQTTMMSSLCSLCLCGSKSLLETVAHLGIQAAEALEHAHQLGIVHRDIKPANLLLEPLAPASGERSRGEGVRLWITDFGLAQIRTEAGLTLTGDLVGTVRYMSPEQARGQRGSIDHRADIYSLGVTLYELLTLEPAFAGNDRQELLRQIAQDDPVPPRRINKSIPAELETIVLKAMEKNPTDRYATAQKMAEDLQRWLREEPIRARPPSLFQRVRKWSRRHPAVLRSVVVMLLLVVVGLAVGSYLIWQEKTKKEQALDLAEQQRAQAEERAALLRQRQYVADMGLAYRLWQRGDRDSMATLLERHVPAAGEEDLRSFEWHYLHGLGRARPQEQLVCRGHKGIVYPAIFSPDGKTIASGGEDRDVRLWNAATGEPLAVLHGHTDDVNWLIFTPDGKTLVSASDDGTIRLWDVQRQRELAEFHNPTRATRSALFTPDGKQLVTAGDDAVIRIWDLTTDQVVGELKGHKPGMFNGSEGGISMLTFSPDGRLLASAGCDGAVLIWDWKARQFRQRMGLGFPVHGIAFSGDATELAAADRAGNVSLWGVASGRLLWKTGEHRAPGRGVQFVPHCDNMLISWGDDDLVRFWQVETGRCWDRIEAHQGRVWCAHFSPDGRRLVTAGDDHTIKVWDVDRLAGKRQLRQDRVLWLAVVRLMFSPDGRTLAFAEKSGHVWLWNLAANQPRATLTHPAEGWSLSFSPDGRFLATGASDGRVRLWDAGTARPVQDDSGQDRVLDGHAAIFAQDGRSLVTGDWNQLVCWDWPSCRIRHRLSRQEGDEFFAHLSLSASPDGKTLALGRGGHVFLWDLATGSTRRLPGEHTGAIHRLAYSLDGRLLASASADGTAKLWDVAASRELATLPGREGSLSTVAFTPDGRTLVTGGSDGLIRLWNVATGQELFTLERHPGLLCDLAISPDGRTLATAGHGSAPNTPLLFLWETDREDSAATGQ